MHLYNVLSLLLVALVSLSSTSPTESHDGAAKWPYAPFTTTSRWIVDAAGHNVTYAGVNWPGAADTMIPEGLQYASIQSIVSKIKSLGMNVIRLTYAIEMIDDIYVGGDNSMKTSFINALGTVNGTAVFKEVVKHNPQFSARTTRLEVFDAVAAECFRHQIYVHLDNHVSKAIWCCATDDGNSWFGDTYFNISNWRRGLSFMAKHGASWGNLMSMSLRNELRSPDDNPALANSSYNWENWYKNIVPAANGINAANPHVLIFLSGLDFDADMTPIPTGASLGGGYSFHKSSFAYADKLVIEIHNVSLAKVMLPDSRQEQLLVKTSELGLFNSFGHLLTLRSLKYATTTDNCTSLESNLYSIGYDALDSSNRSVENVMPVVMTEFGHQQDDANYATVYQTCLESFLTGIHGGWMIWVLAGSYYIRQGVQDEDETWGLLNHNWTSWRDPNGINSVIVPMVSGTKTF